MISKTDLGKLIDVQNSCAMKAMEPEGQRLKLWFETWIIPPLKDVIVKGLEQQRIRQRKTR